MKRLQQEIPGIRIAIIAHGDYCDSYTYITKIMDFTTDTKKLCSFVETVQPTGNHVRRIVHVILHGAVHPSLFMFICEFELAEYCNSGNFHCHKYFRCYPKLET